jgi:hypothetical protein
MGVAGRKLGCQFKTNQVPARIEREHAAEAAPREQILAQPPLHGSARWANARDLSRLLKRRAQLDAPSSMLLGTLREEGSSHPAGFIHREPTAAALFGAAPMIEALRRLDADPVDPPAFKLAYARLMIRVNPRTRPAIHPSSPKHIAAPEEDRFIRRLPFKQMSLSASYQ